jgi:hypothetical protein
MRRVSGNVRRISNLPTPTLSMNRGWPKPPHPNPMASQARHDMVSPQETCASRTVVPQWGGGRKNRANSSGGSRREISFGAFSPPMGEREKKHGRQHPVRCAKMFLICSG